MSAGDIESPRDLAERFRDELRDLVDLGEITPEFSQRVANDLFETEPGGTRVSLRPRVWFRYIEDFVRGAR